MKDENTKDSEDSKDVERDRQRQDFERALKLARTAAKVAAARRIAKWIGEEAAPRVWEWIKETMAS